MELTGTQQIHEKAIKLVKNTTFFLLSALKYFNTNILTQF